MQADYKLPVNLGNPSEFTIKKLASLVLKLTHSKAKIKYLPLPEDDPRQRKPSIDKAKKILGWSPKISLSEGLVKTIAYFSQHRGYK